MGITEWITLGFLAFSSWKDWKTKEISLVLTAAYGTAGIGISIWQKRNLLDFLIPLGIGLMLLAVSVWSRGEVGMGDAWFLLALGAMLTTDIFIKTVCGGMLLAAGAAGILLVICKKGRKTEIPLVPFLFAGYLGGILL
ncbi:prepilin peptidase [Blautia sp. MSJ-19]|uniref:prepilin peptidase n=1 Tax=Blautia sp. MSJ-19 TaxID=2841517 RepID=UPI00209FE8A4|nr:prepilin peptidase [Blautia sp. MSJ-19]